MQYILLTIAALAASFLIGWLLMKLITRGKNKGLAFKVVVTVLIALGLQGAAGAIYLGSFYHALTSSDQFLQSEGEVEVTDIDEGYFFDGPGTDKAIIFYPGAKVETTAYSPMMHYLAAEGVDCFLVHMPANMAILDTSAADSILDRYDYKTWAIGGHSMGGAAAALYAADNGDRVQGLILLAAYPSKQIPDSVMIQSIYGDKDGVLEMDTYEENKKYWPMNYEEVVIPGGNHAGFADYGPQKGDGEAEIEPKEQQEMTVQAILTFMENLQLE